MREPVQVLVYPFRIKNKQRIYLLLKRIKSRGGFWQGVTGGVEKGEDLQTAALRELHEETSLNCTNIMNIGCKYSIQLDDKWKYLYADNVNNIEEHVFVAFLDEEKDPIIDPLEHNGWKWCTFDKAIELLKWTENIEALKQVQSYLKNKSIGYIPTI